MMSEGELLQYKADMDRAQRTANVEKITASIAELDAVISEWRAGRYPMPSKMRRVLEVARDALRSSLEDSNGK